MSSDPYIYPDCTVLINKFGIRDAVKLQDLEAAIYHLNMMKSLPPGQLNYTHLKAIHKHFFEEIYDWAGNERTVDIAKGDSYFAHTNYITKTLDKLFSQLKKENALMGLQQNQEKFCQRLSYYFNEINAVHPFREGNGRTQRVFCSILAEKASYKLDWAAIDRKVYLQASIAGFSQADYEPMTKVFLQISKPIN